jgi:hypothetical protein
VSERALPAWARDVMVDGVPQAELRESGDRAINRWLLKTAMSAINCGQDRIRWEEQLESADSTLGLQVRRDKRKMKRPAATIRKTLDKTWARAEEIVNQGEGWTKEDVIVIVKERVTVLRNIVADPDANLRDVDRAVLSHAADEAERRELPRVALPLRQVIQATGLGARTVRNSLDRLGSGPLLRIYRRGTPIRPGSPDGRTPAVAGKATLYELPTPADVATFKLASPYRAEGSAYVTPLLRPPSNLCDPPARDTETPQETYQENAL